MLLTIIPNTWKIGFEASEGYSLGLVVGQPASVSPSLRWHNMGTAAVVASPDPAFGARSLKLTPGRVDILNGLGNLTMEWAIVKLLVRREAGVTNTLQWWDNWRQAAHRHRTVCRDQLLL
jgi:hypothetical protein